MTGQPSFVLASPALPAAGRENDVGWLQPPESPALPEDEAHVWLASLDVGPDGLDRLAETLSADERTRASRFRFDRDRARFVAARGLLRAILGRYLSLSPSQLRFSAGPNGKPALAPGASADLRFNLSHSGSLALYALARGREVGIDLEAVRPGPLADGVAERCFSPKEVRALRAAPTHHREQAFFACWTRKEAYLKALGVGLSGLPGESDATVAPGEPVPFGGATLPSGTSRWSIRDLPVGPGYAAALAVEGSAWRLRCWSV